MPDLISYVSSYKLIGFVIFPYLLIPIDTYWQLISSDVIDEPSLVVQALRVNTLSKLTFSDGQRFDNLVKDVFPGIVMKDIEYHKLAQAIREVCKATNLIPMDAQVKI